MLQLRSLTQSPFKSVIVLLTMFGVLLACSPASNKSLPAGIVIELSSAFHGQYTLVDMHGKTRSQNSFGGKPALIYFGFTSCPDVCPTGLGVMSAALNELGQKADNIQPLFITLDPDQDSAEVLRDYLAFEPRLLGLTGTADASKQAQMAFKVYSQRTKQEDSALDYTINHSNFFYYVDAQGTPLYALKATLTPQQLAQFINSVR